MATCPTCNHENPDDAKFCLSCGTTLTGEPSTATVVSPSGPLPAKTAAAKRPFWQNWRCCGVGCLVVLLVLLVGVPLVHTLLIRPSLEKSILDQARSLADKQVEPPVYGRGVDYDEVSEIQINDALEEVWDGIPGANNGRLQLEQDQVKLEVTVFGLPLQVSADIRVDDDGGIVINSLDANWVVNIFLTDDGLKKAITDYLNDEYFDRGKIELKALQVTDSKIFLVYEVK
jgi:hypothetical protein